MKTAIVLIALLGSSMANAGAPAKAAICATCHGQNGISAVEIYPNLKGQKKGYIEAQLKAFKAGTRTNAIMAPQAKILTDAEITELATYYSSMK
ncbi:MAG: c-type cytochrome [Bdellovibrionales bacterium]|nr:c-type cytochrome [Bdellovibrionales bacterium]